MSAVAGRFYFVDSVGDFKKASGSFEQVGLEIGAQAVADDIRTEVVDYARELIDLGFGEKLRFVNKKPVDQTFFLFIKVTYEFVEVCRLVDPVAFPFDSYARTDHAGIFAGVDYGFEAHVVHVALFEVVSRGKQKGCFGRTHGAVTEI